MPPTSEDELIVEVDGAGVHLDTLATVAVLRFFGEYLDLLQKLAADRDERLEFAGLRAFEKCGSLATRPSDPELARQVALDAHRLLTSGERPGYGLGGSLARVREARLGLPSHYRTTVKVRGFERSLETQIGDAPSSQTPFATMSLRAVLVRVGGNRPRASFRSQSERRQFSLDLDSREMASSLAAHLYAEIDIVARVGRDESGSIEEGVLKEFFPLEDVDPLGAWTDWYRENGAAPEPID